MIIKKALYGVPTFTDRTKGEIEEIKDNELTLDFFSVSENADGELLISFVTKELPSVFFFASGKLKDFLIDNMNDNPDIVNVDGAYSFNADIDGVVKITYEGKKLSKKNRNYNSWLITTSM